MTWAVVRQPRRSAPLVQSMPDGQTKDRTSAVPKGNVRPLLTDSLGRVVSSHGGWGYLLLFSFGKRKKLSGRHKYNLAVFIFLTHTKKMFKTSSVRNFI